MQGNRGKGRNRLIAPRSHSSAFALFPPPRPPPPAPPGPPSPPARRVPAAPRRWTRKTEVWDEKVDHGRSACAIFFFFPFAILKEHFRMWRRRALCCACGPLGCFSFMRRWCAQMTDMKRKSCGAEHATDNTQKSTKKKNSQYSCIPPIRLHYPSLSCSLPGPIAACA